MRSASSDWLYTHFLDKLERLQSVDHQGVLEVVTERKEACLITNFNYFLSNHLLMPLDKLNYPTMGLHFVNYGIISSYVVNIRLSRGPLTDSQRALL